MQYAQWTMQITHVCMYVHTHGRLPRLKASKGLSLGSAAARARLVQRLSTFVRAHDLADHAPAKKLKIIVQATEEAATGRLSDVDDGALLLATIINMTDVIAHDQRTRYRDQPNMIHMVKNVTAILVPTTRQIFGHTLPNGIQNAWPAFARLFSAHEPSIH